jgi:hypothetical protein
MGAAEGAAQTPDLWCNGANRHDVDMALQGLTAGIDAGWGCYRPVCAGG